MQRRLTPAAPFDADDFGGWAAAFYDEYLRRPDVVRLATWMRLERRPTGPLVDDFVEIDAPKTAAIAAAQAAGGAGRASSTSSWRW